MNYTYLIEEKANKNLTLNEIVHTNKVNILYILCYHISTETRYPFIQFMVEKIPFCNNFIKEEFTLPCIIISGMSQSLESLVMEKVDTYLKLINCDNSKLTNEMYKGIVFDSLENAYVMVNISGTDISGIYLLRNTEIWFALPSEIINQKQICNIDIDNRVTDFFTNMPELSLLTNPETKSRYIIPDVVYTGGDFKKVEFNAIFGNGKNKEYEKGGNYYYFYRSLSDAIKDGGWVKDGGTNKIDLTNKNITHSVSNRLLVDNEYGRYINGGINRYALFIEGKIHIETENELSLTDEMITRMYPEPCLIIAYTNNHYVKSDILVKDLDSFSSLSYHRVNKNLLGEYYDEKNSHVYMIQ